MKKSGTHKVTPLMEQYHKVKAKHPDALMLFRVGDFYETFGEDAKTTASVLGIVLTSRNNGGSDIELAGFPYHSLDIYLPRLVKAGYRVAICEQLEKPSKEKKIVKRGITDIITPGLAIDDKLLDHKSNNFLCSIHYTRSQLHGIAFLDISTGDFFISEGDSIFIEKLIQSFSPTEIIFSKSFKERFITSFGDKYYSYKLDEWVYTEDYAIDKLHDHFEVLNLKGFGVEQLKNAQIAAGACMHYLKTTENEKLDHINSIQRIQNEDFVWLDRFTIRNLELLRPSFENGVALIDVLDHTISPMGARMMKKWLLLPLISPKEIQQRLDCVEFIFKQYEFKELLETQIKKIGDLERLISKASLSRINPREVEYVRNALYAIEPIKKSLEKVSEIPLKSMAEEIDVCAELSEVIGATLVEKPPISLSKGNVIKDGFHEELDDLRNTITNSRGLLLDIQKTEASKTGIHKLKIGFNSVFGYYLEVTNRYKDQGLIPDHWVRKQTLSNSERYITDELKKLETKILTAEEKIAVIEEEQFTQLVLKLKSYIAPIQKNAKIVARLDCLRSFAESAILHQYCKPEINNSLVIDIKSGRHPVIEQQLKPGDAYVPNNILLDNDNTQIMMITGPNMSGKSAVLRQTALITLMAQIGSFVPASEAKIGYVDKLFSRVGASDNISSGESTFMVEMNETASIMNNISERSLILMDEIGRGTSTYDGISIAWSLAEFLHNNKKARPKTLFATHYHELNELANHHPRIKNFNVSTKEQGQKVFFLRKLVEGGSKHSFGIHVAKMAGMPIPIISRAYQILEQLEKHSIDNTVDKTKSISINQPDSSAFQLNMFDITDPILKELRKDIVNLDLNSMTPIECMMKLNEFIKRIEEKDDPQ